MYIKLCDRCGRVTKNKVAFLLPQDDQTNGTYQFNGVWFCDKGITLCNNCLNDFEKFRIEHERFNSGASLVYERDVNLEKYNGF